MRVGNDDPIYGRDGCRSALEAFYARIDALRYDLVELWEHGEATIVEANVSYTRMDGREVTLPAVTIYRTDANDLISDYRVYTDVAPGVRGAAGEPARRRSADDGRLTRGQPTTVSSVSIGSSWSISGRRCSQWGGMHMCVPSSAAVSSMRKPRPSP